MFNATYKLTTATVYLFVVSFSLIFSGKISAASDPTRPLFGVPMQTTVKVKSSLLLQSVIKSGQSYKVIINGKLLSQGEIILTYTVTDIHASSVVLVSPEKRVVLSLFSDSKFVNVVNK
ncbi:MAG: hypothetical protein COB35_13325 [Gammaproteobacteria bacterium]|nr:MAG: hypothetical protein COB35_13325 [Gammaproteobacteria bacterium]